MDAEDLLRHRVRGIIAAAEGRAEHLVEQARRDASLEALEAVAAVERELALSLERLSRMADRLAASLGGEPDDAHRAERGVGAPGRQGRRFIRASMRERPVAALFAAAGDEETLSR